MNKHIELVKKWLGDPNSVTKKELIENLDAADAAADAAVAADAAALAAADAAADAAVAAAYAAYVGAAYYAADAAAYWVKKYEELTGEFGEV